MNLRRLLCLAACLAINGALASAAAPAAAQSPTPQQALTFAPLQQFVDYAKPTAEEIKQCTIRPEKDGNITAWIVRNGQGESLRRFADTNADNTVDQWCYFLDGVEVYRDIDSNFNGKADQYRWFHTAGSRWGIDKDENGKIDSWRVISPHEVAEQLVIALKTRDQARFNLLLLTPAELGELGLSKQRADRVAATVQEANSGFAKVAAEQKVITPQSKYIDFGSSRPAAIPASTAGSTKDMTVCDNASALVQADGKHEQVYLGTLVSVGNAWKLIELPIVGSDKQAPNPFFMAPDTSTDRAPVNPTAPTEEMQKLMADLERLDKQAEGLPPDEQAANVEQRADLLNRLADATTDPDLRGQWHRQLTDMLSVAVQSGNYPQGVERLEQLQKRLKDAGADDELLSHVVFQQMWAQYVVGQAQPGADTPKLQEKWLADLQEFVTNHPNSSDSAEALLQLGMYQEFIGKADEAGKWYTQLVTNFPNAAPAAKARGAVRRLTSVGKPLQLRGQSMQGGGTVDLGAYRGKIVLIQCWATWAERSKEDMIVLKDFYAKNANRGFDIIGVNLDETPAPAKQFLTENRFPWKQMHEAGGLDGRLANELGVMMVPLMLLVDEKGNVVNDNIHVGELESELKRLLGTATAQGAGAIPNR